MQWGGTDGLKGTYQVVLQVTKVDVSLEAQIPFPIFSHSFALSPFLSSCLGSFPPIFISLSNSQSSEPVTWSSLDSEPYSRHGTSFPVESALDIQFHLSYPSSDWFFKCSFTSPQTTSPIFKFLTHSVLSCFSVPVYLTGWEQADQLFSFFSRVFLLLFLSFSSMNAHYHKWDFNRSLLSGGRISIFTEGGSVYIY